MQERGRGDAGKRRRAARGRSWPREREAGRARTRPRRGAARGAPPASRARARESRRCTTARRRAPGRRARAPRASSSGIPPCSRARGGSSCGWASAQAATTQGFWSEPTGRGAAASAAGETVSPARRKTSERGEDHREAKTTRSRKRSPSWRLSTVTDVVFGAQPRRPRIRSEKGRTRPSKGAPSASFQAPFSARTASRSRRLQRTRSGSGAGAGTPARWLSLAASQSQSPRRAQARPGSAGPTSRRDGAGGRRARAPRQRRLREVDELGFLRRRDLQRGAAGSRRRRPPSPTPRAGAPRGTRVQRGSSAASPSPDGGNRLREVDEVALALRGVRVGERLQGEARPRRRARHRLEEAAAQGRREAPAGGLPAGGGDAPAVGAPRGARRGRAGASPSRTSTSRPFSSRRAQRRTPLSVPSSPSAKRNSRRK